MLTHKRLLQVLRYEPESGIFVWRERISIRIMPGNIAGALTQGYVQIGIDGKNYQAHRLAWFYMTGKWPRYQIDHEDLCRANNQWNNLRLATHGQNVQNSRRRKNNTSGFKGVTFIRKLGKWHARIMADGVLYLLGYFETKEEAAQVYREAASKLHGEFARVA